MRAVVTVCSKEYIKGTLVLFHSFLEHHPEFAGDLVVLHDQLAEKDKKELKEFFPLQFQQLSKKTLYTINKLSNDIPHLAKNATRFFSLEAFSLNQYEQLLFMDSDLLCRGNITSLFDLNVAFAACPDASFFENKGRDRLSFLKKDIIEEDPSIMLKTFNAGFFLINFNLLPHQPYEELIQSLNKNTFKEVKSGHTDQYLLNRYFESKVHWLEGKYNYLLNDNIKDTSKHKEGLNNSVNIHYIRHPKPWKFYEILKKIIKHKRSFNHFRDWHLAYRAILKKSLNPTKALNILKSKLLFP